MPTDISGTSAKIYTFPPRGRFALAGTADESRPAFQLPPNAKVASASAWYHDEAIQAEKSRKL